MNRFVTGYGNVFSRLATLPPMRNLLLNQNFEPKLCFVRQSFSPRPPCCVHISEKPRGRAWRIDDEPEQLEEQRLISHEVHGRTFVFVPLVSAESFKRNATQDLIDRVFGGDVGLFVAYLLKGENASAKKIVS